MMRVAVLPHPTSILLENGLAKADLRIASYYEQTLVDEPGRCGPG